MPRCDKPESLNPTDFEASPGNLEPYLHLLQAGVEKGRGALSVALWSQSGILGSTRATSSGSYMLTPAPAPFQQETARNWFRLTHSHKAGMADEGPRLLLRV